MLVQARSQNLAYCSWTANGASQHGTFALETLRAVPPHDALLRETPVPIPSPVSALQPPDEGDPTLDPSSAHPSPTDPPATA